MKKGKIPDVIIYMGIHPSENTPPDYIHNTYNQNIPHYYVHVRSFYDQCAEKLRVR